MPCYTVQQTTVDMGNLDPTVLMAALTQMGLDPKLRAGSIHFNNGVYNVTDKTVDLRGGNVDSRITAIKKSYSGEVVKVTAKKFGWQVKALPNNQYQVVKRSL